MSFGRWVAPSLAAALVAGVPAAGWAAGFSVSDKSVSTLGNAFAGTAALAQDPSVVYTNPAAMQQLDGSRLSLALYRIEPQVRFHDSGSTTLSSTATTGATAINSGEPRVTPNLYYVSELSPRARYGLGIYVPFALGLKYDDQWTGRYHSIESQMTVLNISPALSYQLADEWAVGASVDLQYLTAELSQAVDFGSICVAQYGAGTCSGFGLVPQQNDGKQVLKGDNWDVGYSLGVTFTPSERLHLGAAYHSDTRQNIAGTSDFSNVPSLLQTKFTDSAGHTRVHLPESVSLSAAYLTSERLTLLADYTWTAWSRHKEFRVQFDNGLPDSVCTYNWRDVYRWSVGANYRFSPAWLLRAGYSYDRTPVPSAVYRSPIGPDNDRRWYTFGFNYAPSARFSLDAAFAWVSMANAASNNKDPSGAHLLVGEYSVGGTFASVQANWRY